MRRSTGLLFLFACGSASLGCQDFDAFTAGTGGGGGSTSSTSTTGGGGAGPTTGGGGTGGTGTGGGGIQVSCIDNSFSSLSDVDAFEGYQDTGTILNPAVSNDTLILTANPSSRGGMRQRVSGALTDCALIAKIHTHGDGVATYLALYSNDDPPEYVEIAFVPSAAGPMRCVSGVIDGVSLTSACAAVEEDTDELRISVRPNHLVFEARASDSLQGSRVQTNLPTWIGSTKIALGVDSSVTNLAGSTLTSSFESLGTP